VRVFYSRAFADASDKQLYFLNTVNCLVFASAEGEKISTLELELPPRTSILWGTGNGEQKS
jgi:hypothetical protein